MTRTKNPIGVFPFRSDPIEETEGLIQNWETDLDHRVCFSEFARVDYENPDSPYFDKFARVQKDFFEGGYSRKSLDYIQVLTDGMPIHQEIQEWFSQEVGLERILSRVLRFLPGELLPPHVDWYNSYDDFSIVHRYTVFLEDWVPGHAFFIENENITWKRGEVYETSNVEHGTSNYGYAPKWTLRVTGEIPLANREGIEPPY